MGPQRKRNSRIRAGSPAIDVERRLFELSLGKIRLLDTTLDKAGLPELATLLRELVMEWRAYPSRTRFSSQDLQTFSARLGRVVDGLQSTSLPDETESILAVMREIKSWSRIST